MSWDYKGNDPGISLFNACLTAGVPMVFQPGMKVLEVGCCEADWLNIAAKAWPECSFVGIDTSAKDVSEQDGRIVRRKANVMDPAIFEPESLDAVVSLSTIEHIGLGHYKDPKDPYGDFKAMENIWRWLKPGSWIYFDVPYDPSRYYLRGAKQTECRVYDDAAIAERLSMSVADIYLGRDGKLESLWQNMLPGPWYAQAKAAGTLVEKPVAPVEPFHYVAMVWRKA